jgi:hypothetical protein
MDFFRESLCLQLIGELPEFVEIDTRPESEGMGNRLRRGMASRRGDLAHTGTNCSIHRFLKWNAELPRALFQQSREIIVERQSRPHPLGIMNDSEIDVKTSECKIVADRRGPWCLLSFEAVALLRQRGYRARRLHDGFREWKTAGLPTRRARRLELSRAACNPPAD